MMEFFRRKHVFARCLSIHGWISDRRESSRTARPAAIADLHRRLDATRWPDEIVSGSRDYGLRGGYVRELVAYWRREFDWPAAQARINGQAQYLLDIGGLPLHFIHARSAHADAMPLLITHGWPGSIVEFLELIPRLTAPERFGVGHAMETRFVAWL